MLWVLSNEIPLPQLLLLPISTRVYYSVLLEQYIFVFLSLSALISCKCVIVRTI